MKWSPSFGKIDFWETNAKTKETTVGVYYQNMRNKSTLFNARRKMVKMKIEEKMEVTAIAKHFGVSRKTVYKWIKRFKEEGLEGLKDKSRRPHNSPKKIPKKWENKIIEFRKRYHYFGHWRIKQLVDIPFHENTIYKVIKRNGLIKKNKKVKRRNYEEVKKWKRKLQPFQKVQVDVKYLNDIPNLYPKIITDRFPKYIFSARDVRTGLAFICYAYEKSRINAMMFVSYFFGYLKDLNVDISKIRIQTDNGSEFGGNPRTLKDTAFTKMIEQEFNSKHKFIPPASPTYNSDVETFHKIIERELLGVETFKDINELLAKSYGYMIFFNYEREIRYRGIPIDILKDNFSNYRNFNALFQPIIIDSLLTYYINNVKIKKKNSVTHVCELSN